MSDYRLVLRGGKVLTSAGFIVRDIGIRDGRIIGIEQTILGSSDADMDVTGYMVLPGPIDSQVSMLGPGATDWTGFAAGSAALAAGGVTSFFDISSHSDSIVTSVSAFEAKAAAVRDKAFLNFGLWAGITDENLGELAALDEAGAIGFAARLANLSGSNLPAIDDYTLYEAMRRAADLEQIVGVFAENVYIPARMLSQLREGETLDVEGFLAAHPSVAELEAIQRAVLFAFETGCSLHVFSVSTPRALDLLANARLQGVDVSCSVTPHHLLFSDEDLRAVGVGMKTDPALRSEEDRAGLLEQFQNGVVDIFSSDHTQIDDRQWETEDWMNAVPGIRGGELALRMLLSLDDAENAAENVARTYSSNVARRFLMYPQKGSVEVGSDADLVVIDPNIQPQVELATLHSESKWSPYLEKRSGGMVIHTLVSGVPVFSKGRFQHVEPRLMRSKRGAEVG